MAAPLVSRRPALVVLVAALLLAALAWPAAGLRPDNDLTSWLPADHPGRQDYLEFQRAFGGDASVVIAAAVPASGSPVSWARLEDRLRGTEGVVGVVAPIERGLDGSVTWSADAPLAGPLRGARHAGLLVLLDDRVPGGVAATLGRVETLAHRALGPDIDIAGPVVLHRALDRASRGALEVLLPAAGIGLVAVLIVGLGNGTAALLVLSSAAAASGATLGVVALAGRPLHMVLSVLPALLLVVGTGYALHPVVRYLDDPLAPGESEGARLVRAFASTRRPAFVAALTTALGLGALTLTDLAPVRDLGLFGALGVLVAFGVAYGVLPAAITVLGLRPYGPRPVTLAGGATWIERLLRGAARRPWPVLAGAAGLALVAVVGVARLDVESNVMRLLPREAPVRMATLHIEDELIGLTPVEIRLDGPSELLFGDATRDAQAAVATQVAALPLVTHVLSPYGLLASGLGPDVAAAAAPSHLHLEPDGSASARLTVCSRTVASEESRALAEDVARLTRDAFPPGVRVTVTGAIPLLAEMQTALVRAQVTSFGGAFLLVSAVLWIELRSLALAGLALLPNVAPALGAAGWLGWSGAPLDAATVAVAGVALGLAVDDTVHVLHRYRHGDERPESIDASAGRAIWLTTACAVGGFAAFAWSDFPPARRFGLLVAGAAAVAVAADLVVLPALLALRRPSATAPLPGKETA